MANTAHENVERLSKAETNPDNDAWLSACSARKYRIHDGKVWVGANGILCSVPALVGFGSLAEAIRPFVAQSVLQMVQNRIVQNGEGNVQATVDKAMAAGEGIPGANSNDAFERHYASTVADMVNERRPLDPKSDDVAKKAHQAVIDATIAKHHDGKFMEFVTAGIAASTNRPVSDKKKRVAKAADTSAALDL
jgi:hypothetical protein